MRSVLRQEGVWEVFLAYRQALVAEVRAEARADRLLNSDAPEAELMAQELSAVQAASATDAAFIALDRALLSRLSRGPDEPAA